MVKNSRQRLVDYVSLFAEVDANRLELLQKSYSGTLTVNQSEKLEKLTEIAESIVVAIEENGVLNGN